MQQSDNKTTPAPSTQIRIKDLPIYNENKKSIYVIIAKEKNDLELNIKQIREITFDFIDKFSSQKDRVIQFYDTGVAHTRSTLDYIRSETNIIPKVTFITISGILGFLIGHRSTMRRITYTSLFIGSSTALCYPNEAKQYSNCAYQWSKTKAKIFYNDYIMPHGDSRNDLKTKPISSQISKDQIVKYVPSNDKPNVEIIGDKGLSKDEDADLYTTRK